ncbi:MAG: hypothetical protein KAI08_14195 [Bacteroidales bacterium]|nr:hypothetical protein [Bacteroidales bacterium]
MKKESGAILLIAAVIFLFASPLSGQQTLAEKLGYAADAKLLSACR